MSGQSPDISRRRFVASAGAAGDVSAAVADVALGQPVNGMVEVAGPDRSDRTNLLGKFSRQRATLGK
jgi:hypothetical protein